MFRVGASAYCDLATATFLNLIFQLRFEHKMSLTIANLAESVRLWGEQKQYWAKGTELLYLVSWSSNAIAAVSLS